jgi:hypothetical protein
MKMNTLYVAMFTGLLAISGSALAGKGNTTVTIDHVPPSSNGDGSTAIEDGSIIMDVSAPSVPAHLGHGDCIVDGGGEDFLDSDYCDDGNGGGEEQ